MRGTILFGAGFLAGVVVTGYLTHVGVVNPHAVAADNTAASRQAPRGKLSMPVQGARAEDIRDTFDQGRDGGARPHEATDILAPLGTPVLAAVEGTVKKLFLSKPGGITIYQFDVAEELCYYYAHLDRYADGLKEGARVKQGDVIGYVGTTGNAPKDTPHLHFAIFRLGPEKRWWEGTPVNPYPLLTGR